MGRVAVKEIAKVQLLEVDPDQIANGPIAARASWVSQASSPGFLVNDDDTYTQPWR